MTRREDLLIIAHRGASADHQENTEEAFLGAAAQLADWVELDVRLTAEGALIVHHDPWYHDQRTVWDTPLPDAPPGVIHLERALDVCRRGPRPLGVNVEIKNSPGDLGGDHVPHGMDVVDLVVELLASRRATGIEEEILVSSFDPATIDRVRELDGPPTAQLVFDLHGWPDAPESTADRGHQALHPWDPFVDADLVRRTESLGLRLNTWTVDDPERIRELAGLGVGGIVTNVPARARAVLDDGPQDASGTTSPTASG
jgi:glycerophosphoryl diester phosphodiesterase